MSPTYRNFFIGGLILAIPIAHAIYKSVEEKSEKNCKVSVKSALVVMIDQTGPLSSSTKNSIRQTVDEAIDKAAPYTAVSVYYLQKDSLNLLPDYQGCIPPKKTATTSLTQNEEQVHDSWVEFKKEFTSHLDKDSAVSPQSPIYETVADITRDKKTVKDPSQTQLLVFSDFIQYSKVADLHSSCTDPSEKYQSITRAVAFDATDRPLTNMQVERYLIPRVSRSREFTECIKQVSDLVFNRLGMGPGQHFSYLSRSQAD